MVYKPKEMPEEINVTPIHPLVNFAHLLGTVAVVSAIVYLVLGAIATQLVTRISPQMEAKIGRQILSTIPTVPSKKKSKQRQYLQSLLTTVSKSHSNRVPLTIHIQPSKLPNAVIIPGGHIIVTTALLAQAESANELAFVLAHELGHHVAKDPLKGLGRSLVLITVASALGIGGVDGNAIAFAGSVTNLHYSRKQEAAADVYALTAIVDLYGHGEASLDFFKRIQTEKRDPRGKLSAYVSTHPLTQARIDSLNNLARHKKWQMTGKITELPEIFRQKQKNTSRKEM